MSARLVAALTVLFTGGTAEFEEREGSVTRYPLLYERSTQVFGTLRCGSARDSA